MALGWAASAFLQTEKSFRKIQGFRDLWMLALIGTASRDRTVIYEAPVPGATN